jgi:hypothetical protein
VSIYFTLNDADLHADSVLGIRSWVVISASGNNYTGFAFLFALCTAATLLLVIFVDVKKGRADARDYAERSNISRTTISSETARRFSLLEERVIRFEVVVRMLRLFIVHSGAMEDLLYR